MIDRLLKKMGISEQARREALAKHFINLWGEKAQEELTEIYEICYQKSFFKNDEEYRLSQKWSLIRFIERENVEAIQLMVSGSNFKVNLLQEIVLKGTLNFNIFQKITFSGDGYLEQSKPPLIHAVFERKFLVVRYFLKLFKDALEGDDPYRIKRHTPLATAEDYLHYTVERPYNSPIHYNVIPNLLDCISTIKSYEKNALSDNYDWVKSEVQRKNLTSLRAELVTLIPEAYILSNPKYKPMFKIFRDDVDTYLYEEIASHDKELMSELFQGDRIPVARMGRSELLHATIDMGERERFVELLNPLSADECFASRKSDGRTPLEVAVYSTQSNFCDFIILLIKKIGLEKAAKFKNSSGENILHLLANIPGGKNPYYGQVKERNLAFIKVALILKDNTLFSMTNNKGSTVLEVTRNNENKSSYVFSRLMSAGFDLHNILNTFIDSEIIRLHNKTDLNLFGPKKLDLLRSLKQAIKDPISFYRLFFVGRQYHPDSLNDIELLNYTVNKILNCRSFDFMQGKQSIASILSTNRLWYTSKNNSIHNLESTINRISHATTTREKFVLVRR